MLSSLSLTCPVPSCSPQVNYTQPVVAVKFLNPALNFDHFVECKINAVNIPTTDERDKFAGRVSFRLRIDTD